ncbi:response regulator transcription factor [Acidaminobacter sp. JC074]|uniref:response regulator transcription factor n=1 Tax=Acidaminobacter sp. JC074 TaxID=2530199 RepID=UPI001F10A862|nr:response regulator transcription factor [Acidaminobacter sp. JC074]MCH4887277.1 response regulator transcription factor [Acidaminobacter sp. JC074]
MKEKILVVDDEKDLRLVISDFLVKEGYDVLEAANGAQALEVLYEHEDVKCVILDVMMPVMDGWSTLREIKKDYEMPVIMLTARTQIDDEVFGFELGADDYVAKPFVAARLMARIKSVLKKNHLVLDGVFKFENLDYNKVSCVLKISDEVVELTPKEHELMQFFILNKNIALSREKILDHVWGFDYFGDSRTVDTHIKRLRIKLGDYARLIKTVRGLGYRFEV